MKTRKSTGKNTVFYCDTNKTNYAVLLLLAVSVLAVSNAFSMTRKGCFASDILRGNSTTVSASREINKVTKLVNNAVSLIEQNGEKAFAEFRNPSGAYRKDSLYVYVYDMNGKTLVLPPQQELEGTTRLSERDSTGVYFVREMIDQLKTHKSGWLQYSYPKPGRTTLNKKLSYFEKVSVGGKTYLVGSGLYVD